MNAHMPLRALCAALAVLASACTSNPPADPSLGLLQGDVRISNAVPGSAVTAYLETRAVAVGPADAVRLYLPGTEPVFATGAFQPGSAAAANNEWKLGAYALNPPVEAAGTSRFLVEVDAVPLAPGAQYRFGSRLQGLSGSRLSPPVPAAGDPPAATRFDLSENACVVKSRFRLVGNDADIDALGASIPVTCVRTAAIEEPPGSGRLNQQARAVRGGLLRDSLRVGGEVVELLYRDDPAIAHGGYCSMAAAPDSGFEVTDEGVTIFPGSLSAPTGSCSTFLEQTIEVLVVRNAGALRGRFDVHGETEIDARVVAARNNVPPRHVTPAPVPAGQQPAAGDAWSIEGLAPADYNVYAWALARGGDVLLTLPHRAGANLPVTVGNAAQPVDLGSTFITRATQASGRLTLLDPSGRTELRKLVTRPLPMGNNAPWNDQWSSIAAGGDPQYVPGPGGGSGEGAGSHGRLRNDTGSDAACSGATDACELDYTLLLTGLSPATGPLDGSGMLITRYTYSFAILAYGSASAGENFQRSRAWINLADDRLVARPEGGAVELSPINACLGQIEYEMQVNEASGTLYDPTLAGSGDVTGANLRFAPSAFSSVGLIRVEGMPKNAGESFTAKVVATLPEGARYRLTPGVSFAPAGGGTPTTFSLAERLVPAGSASTLGCGQIAGVCERINDPVTRSSTLLSIGIGDAPQCRPDGGVSLTVTVRSGGEEVDTLAYRVDGGPPVTVCGPCGRDPVVQVPAAGQPPLVLPSGGIITFTAKSGNGCNATYTYPVATACAVPAQKPYQLAYFDDGKLKVYDARSGTPVAEITTPVGAIRYSGDGRKLAVAGGGAIKVFDADNVAGALLAAIPGTFSDAAFSPVDNTSLATLAPAGSDYFLSVTGVGNAAFLGPVTVQPGNLTGAAAVGSSRPRLAWSADGTRLAVAYDTRTGAGDRALRITEWRLSGGQLVPVTGADRQFPLAANEELRAFAYQTLAQVERYAVATSRAVYWIHPGQPLDLLMSEAIGQAVFHRAGMLAFAPPTAAAPAFYSSQVGGFESNPVGDLAPVGGLAVSGFPVALPGAVPNPQMAVARKVHLAPGNGPGFVRLFSLVQNVLVPSGGWVANNPVGLAFRPVQP